MRRNLFLYLAIACFLGIAAIFVFQGYMGVYDTIRVMAGENEQVIAPDTWFRNRFFPSSGTVWPGKVTFSYEVDNRRFSAYSATVQASVWQENQKIMDLHSQAVAIDSFAKAETGWTLDGAQLESRGFSAGQFTVRISRDGVERRVLVYFSPAQGPDKPRVVPIPIPPPSRG